MSKSTDFVVVDADAHVLETERTWDYLEPSEQKYRPLLYFNRGQSTAVLGRRWQNLWFPLPDAQRARAKDNVGKNRPECGDSPRFP